MTQQSKIARVNGRLLEFKELFNQGKFPHYMDLYKNLVGYDDSKAGDESSKTKHAVYWQELESLRKHIEELKESYPQPLRHDGHRFNTNNDYDWTYVEVTFGYQGSYLSLVKLYVPVAYSDLPRISKLVFDFLYERKKRFCYKVAHQHRKDNICIWIMREELENVITFLQSIKQDLLPAPTFCPEYADIGVTRELFSSFNEIIARTVYKFLPTIQVPTLETYIESIEKQWANEDKYSETFKFDKEVIRKSLGCILNGKCPVTSDLAITDFEVEEY